MQIGLLEEHIEEALHSLDMGKETAWRVTGPTAQSTTLCLDDMLVVANEAMAGIMLTLPVATLQNRGRRCAVLITSAVNVVLVRASSGQLVQGSAAHPLDSIGSYVFRSSGSAWLRGA